MIKTKQIATSAGGEQPSSAEGNTPAFEQELGRILARVPPLIRLPKPKGRCPWTGESRTGLLELIAPGPRNGGKPVVRAIYKRGHKHAQRGVWLIPAEGLFRYLLGLGAETLAEVDAAKEERAASRKESAL
ncbi:MAG: hypothetical protein ACYDH9_13950 [Limisphaerales bacterium]